MQEALGQDCAWCVAGTVGRWVAEAGQVRGERGRKGGQGGDGAGRAGPSWPRGGLGFLL